MNIYQSESSFVLQSLRHHHSTPGVHLTTSWEIFLIIASVTRVSLTRVLATTNHSSTHHGVSDLFRIIAIGRITTSSEVISRWLIRILRALFIGHHDYRNLLKIAWSWSTGFSCAPAWYSGSVSSVGPAGVCWQTNWSDLGILGKVNILGKSQYGEVLVKPLHFVVVRMIVLANNIQPQHVALCRVILLVFSEKNLNNSN